MTTSNTIPAVNDTVFVSGVWYIVEQVQTADDHEAAGRPNVAALAREHGTTDLVARRPRGKKLHLLRASDRGIFHVLAL